MTEVPNQEPEPEITPTMLQRATLLWTEMAQEARLESDPEVWGDDEARLIFTGHVTDAARRVGQTETYSPMLTKVLREMGCVVQVARGGGKGIGRWHIVKAPTMEEFKARRPIHPQPAKSKLIVAMEQRIRDLAAEIDQLKEMAHTHE